MDGFVIFNLKDIIEKVGEQDAKSLLSDFSCSMNRDVESFLKYKAIDFAKQGLAATHMVYTSYQGKPTLAGYFALSQKYIRVITKKLPHTLRRRVNRFAQEKIDGTAIITANLIGQLGKNYRYLNGELIEGSQLLQLAVNKIAEAQMILGGKFIYLECENTPKLTDFYACNGFVNFGERALDRDEKDDFSGDVLVQMLKYLK